MAKPTGYGGRDIPDFGVSATAGRIANITDMSELAVRMGGLSWFDRMGTVLMQEGFQGGIANWEHNSYPADAFAVPSARYYSTVPYSAMLVTTDDEGSTSGIQRSFPFPYVSHFGVELHLKSIVAFKYLFWTLRFYDGDYVYYVTPRVNWQDSKLELYNADSAYEKVDDLSMRIGANSPFHVLKVTVDLANERYVRLMFDDKDYNVSDIAIRKVVSGTSPHLDMMVTLLPVPETANAVWIDNIIFTTDEPGV